MRRVRSLAGFTLVELLVVIGIIALLMGILLPVISKAMEHARTAKCASNMRQILLALQMYANDNKGRLMVPADELQPHVGQFGFELTALGQYDYVNGPFWPYVSPSAEGRMALFNCPSDTNEPRLALMSITSTIPSPGSPLRNFSYNFNSFMAAGPFIPFRGHLGRMLGQIPRSATKMLVMEMDAPRAAVGFTSSASGPPGGPPVLVFLTYRHLKRCNFGCADGHVELIDPDSFLNDIPGVNTPAYLHYVNLDLDQ